MRFLNMPIDFFPELKPELSFHDSFDMVIQETIKILESENGIMEGYEYFLKWVKYRLRDYSDYKHSLPEMIYKPNSDNTGGLMTIKVGLKKINAVLNVGNDQKSL